MTRRWRKRYCAALPSMPASAAEWNCWKPRPSSMAGIRVASSPLGKKPRSAGSTSSRPSRSGGNRRLQYRLKIDRRDHRHMVGRTQPASRIFEDRMLRDAIAQRAAHPDMVQPTAAVGRLPVARAIAPPGIDLLVMRHEGSRHVVPLEGLFRRGEKL